MTMLLNSIKFSTCAHCQQPFIADITGKRGREKKYCSITCRSQFHNRKPKDKKTHNKRIGDYFQRNPAKRFFISTKTAAKKRQLIFTLTEDWFSERLARGVCEVTGLPIQIKPYKARDVGNRNFYSPSVDRIDNNIGYIPSNCRLVCWGYNIGKHSFTDRDLNALALALMIRSLPAEIKPKLLKLMPPVLLAALPSGHTLLE